MLLRLVSTEDTAVGQTTHLAARMEQLASAGTILLTADTLRLAEGFVAVKPIGPVPVKGLDTPVEVYEMLGPGPLRSRLQAAAARGLTRFVGRKAHYRQALAFATELGMCPLVAHCHLGLGTLYRRIGKREPAPEHLSTAATMYCEMGMRFWLAKSEQEATASD